MKKILFVALSLSFLGGCSFSNKIVPVGFDEAVKGVESDVKKLGYLSISDMLSDNTENSKYAESYIREKQCFFEKSNPILVFALQSQLTFDLKGAFTQQGSFKISGIPTPTGEIGWGMSSATEQKITWPVSLSSLSALPDLYLEARLKTLEAKGLSQENKNIFEAEIICNYEKLRKTVKKYEDSYSRKLCAATPK